MKHRPTFVYKVYRDGVFTGAHIDWIPPDKTAAQLVNEWNLSQERYHLPGEPKFSFELFSEYAV